MQTATQANTLTVKNRRNDKGNQAASSRSQNSTSGGSPFLDALGDGASKAAGRRAPSMPAISGSQRGVERRAAKVMPERCGECNRGRTVTHRRAMRAGLL